MTITDDDLVKYLKDLRAKGLTFVQIQQILLKEKGIKASRQNAYYWIMRNTKKTRLRTRLNCDNRKRSK